MLGPHFEGLARTWLLHHAAGSTTGGHVTEALPAVLNDAASRSTMQVDAIGLGARGSAGGRPVRCLGEAKLRRMDVPDLERAERARALAVSRGADAAHARIVLFSATGFAPALRRAAQRRAAELVDLDRLYDGE